MAARKLETEETWPHNFPGSKWSEPGLGLKGPVQILWGHVFKWASSRSQIPVSSVGDRLKKIAQSRLGLSHLGQAQRLRPGSTILGVVKPMVAWVDGNNQASVFKP